MHAAETWVTVFHSAAAHAGNTTAHLMDSQAACCLCMGSPAMGTASLQTALPTPLAASHLASKRLTTAVLKEVWVYANCEAASISDQAGVQGCMLQMLMHPWDWPLCNGMWCQGHKTCKKHSVVLCI